MRRALEYAGGLGRDAGPALRGRRRWPAAAHMHEGEWSSRLGIPGMPAEAEELMVARDIALARLTGARVHFLHLSTAGSVDLVRGGQGRRACRSPPRPRPHHFTLTDAALRRLRPGVQGQPAAAHRRRRGRGQGRAGRRHHRRHRHRPRPPRPGGQGAALRPGPARACSAWRRRWPWPSPSSTCPSARVLALLSLAAGRHRRPRPTTPRRPDRAGRAGQPVRDRPDGHAGRSTRPRWPAAAATRPTPAGRCTGRVRHTVLARRAGGRRRRGPAMSGRHGDRAPAPRPCWSWPTAPRSRARPSAPSRPAAWPPARSCSTPCCPATRRSSPTRPTPGRSSPSPTPTSATTGSTPPTTRAAGPSAAGVIVRDLARRPSNWRADGDLDAFLRRHGVPGIAGIDTRRLTRHIRDAGRHARRLRHRRRGRR